MRRFALLALVLAAGCGGDGNGLTREEYVAELDEACADFNATQEEIGEPETDEEVVEKGSRLREEFGAAIERVRDLGDPPDAIADEVDRFLELGDELHERFGEVIEAVEENDLRRAQEVTRELERLDEESDEIAIRLGAESCAID